MVISGTLGNISLGTGFPSFAITSYSLDGGYTFIEVSAYGGNGMEEMIQGLQRSTVVARGYIDDGKDPKMGMPTRGTTATLTITLKTGKTYTDTVLCGPFTLVGNYKGVNEYSVTVAHASGATAPEALWS